jgi:hypothetical protein
MPFGEASPAAGGRRVLRHKHRMISKRRLFPVIGGSSRRETFVNKISRVLEDRRYPL